MGSCFSIQPLWEQWESSLLEQDVPCTELLPWAQITTHWLLQHWLLTKWHCRTQIQLSLSLLALAAEHPRGKHIVKSQTKLQNTLPYCIPRSKQIFSDRHTTLAQPELLLFRIIQHTLRRKKATCNSINLFSSNYLITLSNCRFYVHNLKFHRKATGHNSK